MGEKFGKIRKAKENPIQPVPYGYPPQYPYPQQPQYPQQTQPMPMQQPMMRPMVQGDLFRMERVTQNKKDFIIVEIVVDEKLARALRIGRATIMQ